MVTMGYALSSEEHRPNDLVRYARRAEEAGFEFALISDHYHPWTDRQGQSPFVWSVIGGIAHATGRLRLGTGVTCPTMRIHPAIIAQAAATAAAMMPERFFVGVGTGENLNEHVLGQKWPPPDVRIEMLEEAIAVLVERFEQAGGRGKEKYGQYTVCWARDEREARRIAHEWWPNAAVPGALTQELALPKHFEQVAGVLGEDHVAEEIVCGPDPERHLEEIRKHDEAGFTHVYVHQVGPDQEGFFRFYERDVLPRVGARGRNRPPSIETLRFSSATKRESESRVPPMPRWLRQPRHGGRA